MHYYFICFSRARVTGVRKLRLQEVSDMSQVTQLTLESITRSSGSFLPTCADSSMLWPHLSLRGFLVWTSSSPTQPQPRMLYGDIRRLASDQGHWNHHE